ncbi:MAG: hypothetical protein HYY01_10455 [Chloroflexi bacterium]|nr:hypothetical protein [Chloroflexota bacterium]
MTSPPREDDSVAKIVGLTLANAMVFHEVLANNDSSIRHIRELLESADVVSAFADQWRYILEHINYHPIFNVAHRLVIALPSNPDVDKAVHSLARAALDIVRQRAALSHDLMGRIYHQLLAEAKYLGTYYTSIPAATLLLKIALAAKRWEVDWSNLPQLSTFGVGDLACGTGTLLMAAADAMTDNYTSSCAARHRPPRLDLLSRTLMEDALNGYDVLPSALHLTASTLALRVPDVTFTRMRLWNLPLGGRHHRLGSIEFLTSMEVPITADLFGGRAAADEITPKGDVKQHYAPIRDLDLCVMNPPFTRSVGGNLLFGSLPEAERRAMQKELAKLLRIPRVLASSTAGLGSVFVATGDFHLKRGGRMALVLPKALLSGVAWQETRRLFRMYYQLEYLVVSHDPERWNFSENTDLSEVLLVARKLENPNGAHAADGNVVCVNLWKNLRNIVEALTIARGLNIGEPPDVERGQGALEVTLGDVKVAEAVSVPWTSIREGLWMWPCAFAQSDLVRAARSLTQGSLWLPGSGVVGAVQLCPLGDMGTLGPDVRDIHDGFRLATGKAKTAYPAFWSHDASKVLTLAQSPNRYLSPLARASKGRPLRKATDLWPRAGRLLIAERTWLKTQRLAAIRLGESVVSNVWWPVTLSHNAEEREKALALWLNSTLGLLVLWSHREETRGAWIKFKKPVLSAMPVLDVTALAPAQKGELVSAYDRLCQQPLLPFPEMANDPVRAEIDAAIAKALNLPDFSVLRKLLAQEPVVCLMPLY